MRGGGGNAPAYSAAAGRLLGVGFDAFDEGSYAVYNGIQVSLFDTSDPHDMKRLDNHVLGVLGSTSDVTGDPHGFYFDQTLGLVGVPVVALGGTTAVHQFGTTVDFSGAVLYHLGDTALTEAARISHADLIPSSCASYLRQGWAGWQGQTQSLDINRLFTVDGRLLSFSRFGIKAHDAANPAGTTASVTFNTQADQTCSQGVLR